MLLLDQGVGPNAFLASEARGLVEALIAGGASSEATSEPAIEHGMRFGGTAFAEGASIHHVLKALDLLMAMTLFAMESTLAELEDGPVTTAADGVRLSRRLQRRGAFLTLAATRGYTHAYMEALRDRFRHLRHDLRTPLGTIKSVLALMDDESVPLEARADPSFRAMATRNAKSLDELIGARLGDAATLLPATAGQDTSVRAVACAVRRELRSETERRGVSISVDEGGPHGRMDAAGFELLLRELLEAAVQECNPGARLHIAFDRTVGHAVVTIARAGGLREEVSREGDHSVLHRRDTLERLSTLARQIGASITVGGRTAISIPLRASDASPVTERTQSVSHDVERLREGETRHDIGGARESHHGQTGAH
jgi:signal transduction histidine kinase